MTSNPTAHPRMNEQIRANELRVVGEDGSSLGVMSRSAALGLAQEQELDLVEVAPDAKPPVVKLMNYAKEKFRAERAAKKNKKHDARAEVKEIQLKPTTDVHDLATKSSAATKFLVRGNRVKVVVVLRGRLQQRPEMADAALEHFYSLIEAEFVAEHRSSSGSRISVMLRPTGAVASLEKA